jgi:nitrate reductase NapE component
MRQKPRPPVDHHLAGLLVSRGRLHAHQYLQTRDSHNLEDAISTMRKVVALVKGAQSDILGPALGNLAALLLEQFKLTGRDTALNEALQLARWALDCLSDRDADHSVLLATLGSILASQYDRLKRTQDLEDAISSLQIATRTQSPSDDGDLPAVVLNNLACVMGRRYENSGRREDLNDAITSALDATEMGLSNCPSLLAGVGSTLAGLLARQYESTGQLDSLANALFELRIVTEVEPEFPELDALLVQLGGLAKEQHALRAQPTDERIEVSQSRYPNILTVFLVFSLSPVLSLTYPGAFYPFIIFFGGIMSNWVFQKYIQPISRDERRNSLFDSVPVWIQRIFSSPYDQFSFKFAPTLFSTPWIETPSTIAFLGSDEDLHNEGRLRRRRSIHDRRFESGYDQLLRVGARNRSPAHDEDCNQGDIDGLHLGFNKSPRARLCHPSQAFPQSSRTKYYENDVERQTQLPYKHLTDSKAWDDIKDSQSDDGFLPALIVASEEGRGVNEIFQTKQPISTSSTNRRPTTENVKKTVSERFLEVSSLD